MFSNAMLADSPLETVAACTAGWWRDDDGRVTLLWRNYHIAESSSYARRGGAGAVVTPDFISPYLKQCRQTGEALLLAHTHPFSSVPGFSGIDDGGEDVLIPKVRARAPTAPHGAIVLGTAGATVRIWPPGSVRTTAAELDVVGSATSGGEHVRGDPEYQRQDLALGEGSSAMLSAKHVAVVGVGGLGWDIATLLWSHGVGKLTLIDPDGVEPSNRPRLRGSRPIDVGMTKVDALSAVLGRMRIGGHVTALARPIQDVEARAAAADVDVIVTATDNLLSRLNVDQFARRLLIPLVDGGINIELSDSRIRRVGGRVNVSWPTGPCLTCMGVLSPDAVAAEAEPLGYRGRGSREEAAVGGFNAVVAGLAVVEVLDVLLGLRPDAHRSRHVVYDALRGVVREISVPAPSTCGSCGSMVGAVFGALP
jgi:molybdopterin/thiamine biosynthesis adenylyltransferase